MATTLRTIAARARVTLLDLGTLTTPSTPTITPQGTTGATSYGYKIVALSRTGYTAASTEGTTATGNATLSATNNNRITWSAITGATYYQIYRTTGGATQGIIATVGSTTTLDDTGLTGGSETAPTAASGTAFWTEAELIDHAIEGCRDLWGADVDLHQEHHVTNDATNVSLAADTATLTGVPADVFRVLLIEPRDLSSTASGRNIIFLPRDYNSPEMIEARGLEDQDPTSGGFIVYYAIHGVGSPISAPTIEIAPQLTSALNLRFVYIPTLGTLTATSNNPIPGESDNAVFAWIIAYARAKEREDRSPDPNWLAVYATEKQNIMTRLTPRQEQEPEYVTGLFEEYW